MVNGLLAYLGILEDNFLDLSSLESLLKVITKVTKENNSQVSYLFLSTFEERCYEFVA